MLFTEEKANTKLAKGEGSDFYTVGLFLSPSTENSKGIDLCPFASGPCREDCLYTSGRAAIFKSIIEARKRKTEQFLNDRTAFIEELKKDLYKLEKKAIKQGKKLVARLNGTSDIPWPRHIFETFPNVQFYDYSKSPFLKAKFLRGNLPENYHVTFSYSGENMPETLETLQNGGNVAVVFSNDNFPETWQGYKVISGEKNDLRFLDEQNVVIGLKAKGKAKKDLVSNFIIQIEKRKG
jgi:hypothetical protein